ncbi:MAG: hypothetical protein ACM3QW_10445 [Ignavibacteriales bacterium]
MEGGKEFKIGMAVAAFILTLALSLGGFNYYQQYVVNKPLQESLQDVAGVKQVSINDENDPIIIKVSLKNDVDLKKAYLGIDQLAAERLNDKVYEIIIEDNESGTLAATYDRLELAVYEGIANNSFLWLSDRVEKEASSVGAKYKIQVDEKNLYITLIKDKTSLCRVISRESLINSRQTNEGGDQSA